MPTKAPAKAAVRREVQFGSLILAFTSRYNRIWTDEGSGAHNDVAFWQPVPPTGFHALGSIGLPHYNDPNGKVATLCVKAAAATLPGVEKPALKRPLRYNFVWNDAGSGATEDGSCWNPQAPDGYVALGSVFQRGYNPPSLEAVMCVAKELVYEGVLGETIWIDRGSGADRDFGAWQINTLANPADASHGLFAVNSFTGHSQDSKPGTSAVAYTLRLPVPVDEAGEAPVPQLNSKARPADRTTPVIDRIVTVPFTAVIDADKTTEWRIQNSPFYKVERSVFYDLLLFENNETSGEQIKSRTVTAGITKEQSQTFSINTGISISHEHGIETGFFAGKVTMELSIELGYSFTTTSSVFQSEEHMAQLTTQPGHASALWIAANSIRVVRDDGTPVARSLDFGEANTAYFTAQFPPAFESGQGARYRRTRTRH